MSRSEFKKFLSKYKHYKATVNCKLIDIEQLLDDGYDEEGEEIQALKLVIAEAEHNIKMLNEVIQPLDELSKLLIKTYISHGASGWIKQVVNVTYLSEKTACYLFGDIVDYCSNNLTN